MSSHVAGGHCLSGASVVKMLDVFPTLRIVYFEGNPDQMEKLGLEPKGQHYVD